MPNPIKNKLVALTEEKWWLWLLLIMLLAGVVRLCIQQTLLRGVPFVPGYWKTDLDGWGRIAENLINGKGYLKLDKPTASRGPVYPFFLYVIYHLFGIEHYASLAAQIFWNMAICGLIYALALELFGNRQIGLLAAFGWALYFPETVIDTIWLFSEPIFIVLLLLFSLALVRGIKCRKIAYHALAGALLGITTLCRPVTQAFSLVLLPVLFWLFRPDWRFALRAGSMLLLCFLLVLSPWVIRNYKAFGILVPASTIFGYNLYVGNSFLGEDMYLTPTDLRASERKFKTYLADKKIEFNSLNEAEQDVVYRRAAWEIIRQHPWRYTLKSFVRGIIIWFNIEVGAKKRLMSFLVPLWNIPILVLGIWGWLKFCGEGCDWGWPFAVLTVYNTLVYMFILGSWRFSIPMIPYLLLFGAYAILRYQPSTPDDTSGPSRECLGDTERWN